MIVDGRGRVLLVRHSYGRKNWELPGGMVEPDESATEAVLREVKEETGLSARLGALTGVYWESRSHGRSGMHHFIFRCEVDADALPRPDGTETTACAWIDRAEPPKPISDFTLQRIDDALGAGVPAFRVVRGRTWIE